MPEPAPSAIHRIRLQGPWEWAVPTPVSTQAWTWNRVRLPDDWDRLPAMQCAIWFRRRFNHPTGTDSGDLICVAITSTVRPSSVMLNGQELSRLTVLDSNEPPVFRYDLRSHLAARNLLEIVFGLGIAPPDMDSGMGHPIVLEIASASSVSECVPESPHRSKDGNGSADG